MLTKAEEKARQDFVKARIERRKAARGGKSRAEAAREADQAPGAEGPPAPPETPAQLRARLTIERINAREARRLADLAAEAGLRKARRMRPGGSL